MSLINEALKRAKDDKAKNGTPGSESVSMLTPAEGGPTPPPLPPSFSSGGPMPPLPPLPLRAPRRRSSSTLILAALALGAGTAGSWYLWQRSQQAVPASAQAVGRPTIQADAPGAQHPKTPKAREAQTPRKNAPTVIILRGEAAKPKPPTTQPAPVAGPTIRPAEVVKPAPPTTQPAARTVQVIKPPSRPQPIVGIGPTGLHLSGIMRGPDGIVAIINGSLVGVGQSINGAKVVEIGKNYVELESAGRRFTIRM